MKKIDRKGKKILITNVVSLNVGDAAILLGMIKILRVRYGEDCQIVIFDKSGSSPGKYYNWSEFRKAIFFKRRTSFLLRIIQRSGYAHWVNRINYARFALYVKLRLLGTVGFLGRFFVSKEERADLECYLDADLILSSGGTYLIEKYSITREIMDCKIAIIAQKPLVFFTQSLGPFYSEKTIESIRPVFDKATFVLLRDGASLDNLRKIGVKNEKMAVAPDAAFALFRKDVYSTRERRKSSKKRVCISVRDVGLFVGDGGDFNESVYYDCVAALTQFLISEFDAEVTFLSTCQGISEYRTDDSFTAGHVVEKISPNLKSRVLIDSKFRGPEELINAFSSFDLVLATRMHAAILAMCSGTPVIGLAYEFKMKELYRGLGIGEFCIQFSKIDFLRARQKASKILLNEEKYCALFINLGRRSQDNALESGLNLPEI